MVVCKMTRRQAPAVAALHRDSIRTGLTAWLGQRFCQVLYWGMANTPHSFVLVCEDEKQKVLGFICCATNTSKMYKAVLARKFLLLAIVTAGKFITRPLVLKSIWTSLRRPKTFVSGDFAQWDLPEAEVVSIAVLPETQGRGVGTQLVEAACREFRQRGLRRVRVWTSEDNLQATAFYQKQGFSLLGMRQHHTGGINVFVMDMADESDAD